MPQTGIERERGISEKEREGGGGDRNLILNWLSSFVRVLQIAPLLNHELLACYHLSLSAFASYACMPQKFAIMNWIESQREIGRKFWIWKRGWGFHFFSFSKTPKDVCSEEANHPSLSRSRELMPEGLLIPAALHLSLHPFSRSQAALISFFSFFPYVLGN